MKKIFVFILTAFFSFGMICSAAEVTSPVDGDILIKGVPFKIKWNLPDGDSHVLIKLLQNGIAIGRIVESTSNNGEYEWPVDKLVDKPLPLGENFKIRIKSTSSTASVLSRGVFSIRDSTYIKVVYPNGGERIGVPTTLPIRWQSSADISRVNVIGIMEGRSHLFAGNLPNSNQYDLSLGKEASDGKNYKIRLENAQNQTVFDESDRPFEIYHLDPSYITVLEPREGDRVLLRSRQLISWNYGGFDGHVRVELWQNNQIKGYITESTNATRFDWTVGNMVSPYIPKGEGFYVKVVANSHPSIYGTSGKFEIYDKQCEIIIYAFSFQKILYFLNHAPDDKLDFDFILKNNGPLNFTGSLTMKLKFDNNSEETYYLFPQNDLIIPAGIKRTIAPDRVWRSTFFNSPGEYQATLEVTLRPKAHDESECFSISGQHPSIIVEKKIVDLQLSNCTLSDSSGRSKLNFKKGEEMRIGFKVKNSGNSECYRFRVKAWSVFGKAKPGVLSLLGNISVQKEFYDLKSGREVTGIIKTKVTEKRLGTYTLGLKAVLLDPKDDNNPENNQCSRTFQLVSKLKKLVDIDIPRIAPNLTIEMWSVDHMKRTFTVRIKNKNFRLAKIPNDSFVVRAVFDRGSPKEYFHTFKKRDIANLNQGAGFGVGIPLRDYIIMGASSVVVTVDSTNVVVESDENDNECTFDF